MNRHTRPRDLRRLNVRSPYSSLEVHDTACSGVPFLSLGILGGHRIDGLETPTEYPLGHLVAGWGSGVQCQGEDRDDR